MSERAELSPGRLHSRQAFPPRKRMREPLGNSKWTPTPNEKLHSSDGWLEMLAIAMPGMTRS